MKTEITENKKVNGWVFYGADCRFCARLARRVQFLLARRRFALLPLQSPWARAQLALPDSERLAEMRLMTSGGKVFGGVDALLEIGRHCRLAWSVRQRARVPAMHHFFCRLYSWISRNRSCANIGCRANKASATKPGRLMDLLPFFNCHDAFMKTITPVMHGKMDRKINETNFD